MAPSVKLQRLIASKLKELGFKTKVFRREGYVIGTIKGNHEMVRGIYHIIEERIMSIDGVRQVSIEVKC